MGTSHFTSNIEADGNAVTVAGFSEISATTLTDGTISITGGALSGASSISGTTVTDGTASMSGGAISGVTGAISTPTNITMSGVLSGATSVKTTNYLQIGDGTAATGYLFLGQQITNNNSSILAAASSLVTAASLKGSIFVSASPVAMWVFTATHTAATVGGLGV